MLIDTMSSSYPHRDTGTSCCLPLNQEKETGKGHHRLKKVFLLGRSYSCHLGSDEALRGAPWWLTMKSGDKGNKDNELNYKGLLDSKV